MYIKLIAIIRRKIHWKKEIERRSQKKRGDIFDSAWLVQEEFIATVKDTIRKSTFFNVLGPQRTHGLNDELYYQVDDKRERFIGYLEGGNFLLDSKFIYERFKKHWRIWSQSQEEELSTNFPELSEFYKNLYEEDVIIPYGLYFPRPLYRIIKNGNPLRVKYFYISQETVGAKPRYFLD